jgi:hypothetical protein
MNLKPIVAKHIREHIAALNDDELIQLALGERQLSPKSIPAHINEGEPTSEPTSTVKTPRTRTRITPDESQQVWDTLNKEQRGLAMGEITLMTGISAPRVRAIIKRLTGTEQSVFAYGERRHTRYAVNADMARRASILAQGKDPGKEA